MIMLEEGDIIELRVGHDVYAKVPEHFLYSNRRGSFKLDYGKVTIGGELDYLAGRYVVIHAGYDGGGHGHGSGDAFPDWHHVFAEKLDGKRRKVDFYQSGSFTAMITDIEPVEKAVRNWTVGKRQKNAR